MPDEIEFSPYAACCSLSDKVEKLRSLLRHREDIQILDEVLLVLHAQESIKSSFYLPPKV